MNRIGPHRIWIGHIGDGRDHAAVREEGIEGIVQLAAEEPPLILPRDLLAARFPLLDGSGNRPEVLDMAIRFVGRAMAHRLPILIVCGMGLSRSLAIAAAALSPAGMDDPEGCLAQIRRHRPIDVPPGLWSEVRRAAGSALLD